MTFLIEAMITGRLSGELDYPRMKNAENDLREIIQSIKGPMARVHVIWMEVISPEARNLLTLKVTFDRAEGEEVNNEFLHILALRLEFWYGVPGGTEIEVILVPVPNRIVTTLTKRQYPQSQPATT